MKIILYLALFAFAYYLGKTIGFTPLSIGLYSAAFLVVMMLRR